MHNLPRITFILGKSTQQKAALAHGLLTTNPDALPVHLSDTVDAAAGALFFNGTPHKPDWRKHPVNLLDKAIDTNTWCSDYEDFLRDQFGPGALGFVCLHTLVATGDIEMYDNFIIPDVVSYPDIFPFYHYFKPQELLIIQTTPVVAMAGDLPFSGTRIILLADATPTGDQLQTLEVELSPARNQAPETSHGQG